jgi:hypothetical protein
MCISSLIHYVYHTNICLQQKMQREITQLKSYDFQDNYTKSECTRIFMQSTPLCNLLNTVKWIEWVEMCVVLTVL